MRCWRFYCAILFGTLRKTLRSTANTHSADYPITSTTSRHHIASTVSKLAGTGTWCSSLHKIPICGSGAISKCMFRFKLDIFVLAMQSRSNEVAAILEQVGPDLATGSTKRIEIIKIDRSSYRSDDSAYVSLAEVS